MHFFFSKQILQANLKIFISFNNIVFLSFPLKSFWEKSSEETKIEQKYLSDILTFYRKENQDEYHYYYFH